MLLHSYDAVIGYDAHDLTDFVSWTNWSSFWHLYSHDAFEIQWDV